MKKLVCESLYSFLYEDASIMTKKIVPEEVPEVEDKEKNTMEQKKPNITFLQTGYGCLTSLKNNEAMYNEGQGLYIWTYEHELNSKKKKLKFGQYGALGRGKTPLKTISGYKAGKFEPVIILYAVRFDDDLIKKFGNAFNAEIKVQNLIKENRGYTIKGVSKDSIGITSREVFGGIELDEMIKIINEVLYGTRKLKSFAMRPEQKVAHDQIVNNFRIGKKEFLLAAKMRYGKNFTFLNVAKTLEYKNILVLTYKPQVFQSLKDDIENHINFHNWKFVEFKDQRNLMPSVDVPQVIVSSAQLAQYKSDDEKDAETQSAEFLTKNIKALSNINFDMVVADEYHYGTGTYNFKNILDKLKFKHIIWVSGTAMKDIAMGRFEDEDMFVWDYIKEQEQKNIELKQKEKNPNAYYSHIDMPTMKIHTIHIDEKAKGMQALYTKEEGFNMKKLISVENDNITLKNPLALRSLLEQIAGTDVNAKMSIYKNPKVKGNLDHTFWVLDKNTDGIKAMAKLMNSMSEFNKYYIIVASGDQVSDISDVKETINRAIDEGKKTITLSCSRFKEGVTVPEWNGVVMLDQGVSIQEYLQAIFRCQSPDPYHEKNECYVFDFNPQRCLQMIYDTCENIDKTGNRALGQTIKEFLDYAPILDHINNQTKEIDTDAIIENFRAHGSFSQKFSNTKNINPDKIDEDIVKSLSTITSHKRKKQIEINDQDIELGKTAIQHKIATGGEIEDEAIVTPSKNEVKKYLEKIQTVLSNIPEYLFNSPESEETVEHILLGKEKDLFKEITDISLDTFKMWCDKGLINKVLLNRNIRNFNDAEQKFMSSKPGLEEKEKFFKQHFNMRAESGATPTSLVNEMLDKLPADMWTDPKKTFCDPCMGTGTFLVAIKGRLMNGLESFEKDTEKREKYILDNMLWGGDINKSKTLMTKKLINNINSNNIKTEDSLTRNWNMKFDVIVMNPPYQGEQIGGGKGSGNAIWYKFVKLSFDILKEGGHLCCVHPCNWRMPPVSKKIEEARILLLSNQIEYLELYKTPFEGVNIVVDWYIAKKIPKYKKTKIKYINGIYEHYINHDFILNYGGPLIESIKNKVLTIDDNGLKARKSFGGLTVLDKNKPKGKYKFAHGARFLKNEWTYFDYPHIYQYNPKVIISAVGPLKAIYDKGEIGIGDHVHYLLVKNKKEADFFISIINSKLSKFFQKAFAGVELHKTYDLPARWNVPDPLTKIKLDTAELKTEQDIYKYFNLTQEEIDYVESQIK